MTTRRKFLSSASTGLIASLTGCFSSGDSDPNTQTVSPTRTDTETPTLDDTRTPTDTKTQTEAHDNKDWSIEKAVFSEISSGPDTPQIIESKTDRLVIRGSVQGWTGCYEVLPIGPIYQPEESTLRIGAQTIEDDEKEACTQSIVDLYYEWTISGSNRPTTIIVEEQGRETQVEKFTFET